MLVKHFKKEDGGWRINRSLRDAVQFREWNLLSDLRPLGIFDVVFCRNVLLYFDQPTKNSRAGRDRRADSAGWRAVPGRGGDGARDHRPVRAIDGIAGSLS